MTIVHLPRLEIKQQKDMYHCHFYHFSDICIMPVNKPIRSYQIQLLEIILICLKSQLHRWNCITWQTPSARNYHLTAVFKITRQMVVSRNRHLTAIFTKVYHLTAILKTTTRR